jgi:peptide chain release factor 1
MSLLQSKLLSQAQDAQISEQAQSRKLQVGSGDRSERIRTYNYPQNRVTDHRVNLTLYKLEDIMTGQLDQVIAPLTQEYHAEQLVALTDG